MMKHDKILGAVATAWLFSFVGCVGGGHARSASGGGTVAAEFPSRESLEEIAGSPLDPSRKPTVPTRVAPWTIESIGGGVAATTRNPWSNLVASSVAARSGVQASPGLE